MNDSKQGAVRIRLVGHGHGTPPSALDFWAATNSVCLSTFTVRTPVYLSKRGSEWGGGR